MSASPVGHRHAAQRIGCVVVCLWALPVYAQIYVGVGADAPGTVVLSNHPSSVTPTLLLSENSTRPDALTLSAPSGPRAQRPLAGRAPSPAVAALIASTAREFSVAEALVKAVIAVESGFEPNARSPKGAMGLMQLMPETARRFGARDAFAAEDNVRAGTAYLRWLLDYFSGDVQLALAAYNAGENAVERAGRRVPDIPETRAYVPKVLSYWSHYHAQ